MKKFLLLAVFLILLSSLASAYIDVNVNSWQGVDENRYIGDKNGLRSFVLDFNVFDTNGALLVDLNATISFGSESGSAVYDYGGTAIVGNSAWSNTTPNSYVFDLNLMDMNADGDCIGDSWQTGVRCLWEWDLNYPATSSGYSDGNKVIDINVFEWNRGIINSIADGNNDSNSFYLDMTVPDLNTPTPNIFSTVSTSTPSFTANAGDVNSGLHYCRVFISYEGAEPTTSSIVKASNRICTKLVTLTWMQRASVHFRGFDRSGNYDDANTVEYEYSLAGAGNPADVSQGGADWTEPIVVAEPSPAEALPPELFEALPPVAAPAPIYVPFLSDVMQGALIVWEWLLGLFRFA